MVTFKDLKIAQNPNPVATKQVVMSGPEVEGQLHTAMVSGLGGLKLDIEVFISSDDEMGMIWCREAMSGPRDSRSGEPSSDGHMLDAHGGLFVELATLVPREPDKRASTKFRSLSEFSSTIGEPPDVLLSLNAPIWCCGFLWRNSEMLA